MLNELKKYGIDVEDALNRFMHNEDIYKKYLRMFPSDNTFNKLQLALDNGDTVNAFKAAHTIKGMASNLSLLHLLKALTPLLEELRAGKMPDKDMNDNFITAYNYTINILKKL